MQIKNTSLSFIFIFFSNFIFAQGILGKINAAIKKDTNSNIINQIVKQNDLVTKGNAPSEEDIINGLKEALTIGTNNSIKKLGVENGFFNDAGKQ